MSFFKPMEEQDIDYDGFYDGQNKTVPDGYEANFIVTDGFFGIEEGKSQQVCFINIILNTDDEFDGQKYRYNAKLFDMNADKRDLAMRNLGVLDAQAGFPMTNGQLEPTTENIQDYWAGSAEARVRFGLLISTTDANGNDLLDADGNSTSKEVNFVRGFGYLREKMRKPGQPTQKQQTAAGPAYAEEAPLQGEPAKQAPVDDDIDF